MTAKTPPFKTKDGRLTPYALACGYIEVHEGPAGRVTLFRDSCWHVIRTLKDTAAKDWRVRENPATLTEARKLFDAFKRQVPAKRSKK